VQEIVAAPVMKEQVAAPAREKPALVVVEDPASPLVVCGYLRLDLRRLDHQILALMAFTILILLLNLWSMSSDLKAIRLELHEVTMLLKKVAAAKDK